MLTRAWVVCVVLVQGCAYSRVALPDVPSIDAPMPVRAQAKAALAITSSESTAWFNVRQPKVVLFSDMDFVTLGNGMQVEDPRDLLPAVRPDSATAKLLEAYEVEVETATAAKFILFTSGLATMAGAYALTRFGQSNVTSVIAGLLIPVGAMAAMIGLLMQMTPAGGSRLGAFAAYNDDLAKRLGL